MRGQDKPRTRRGVIKGQIKGYVRERDKMTRLLRRLEAENRGHTNTHRAATLHRKWLNADLADLRTELGRLEGKGRKG